MAMWFETFRGVVHPWMCDQFGHLNVRFYAHVFDDSGFALWPMVGVGRLVFEKEGVHTVVTRTETDFHAELPPGRFILVRSAFERIGGKSVSYVQELQDALGVEQPVVSQQLAVLRANNIVAGRKEGVNVRYSVRDPLIAELLGIARRIFNNHLVSTQGLLRQLQHERRRR